MRRFTPLLTAVLLGFGFTILLNATSLHTFLQQRLTVADLGAQIGSPDEAYYFALIRDVKDGHATMGNASFYEHRDTPALSGFGLLPQGFIAKYTTLDLATVVLLGDLFYPFIITVLMFFVFRRFSHNDLFVTLFTLGYMSWWGVAWYRVMNPQVTDTFFLLALLAIVWDQKKQWFPLRGVAFFALFIVQPVYAAYILAVEGLLTAWDLWKTRRISSVFARWPIAVGLIAAAGLQYLLQRGVDPVMLADTYARRGLISSHVPAAPQLQLTLLVLAGLLFWRFRQKKESDAALVLILLVAGLVVLNQSVVHGKDVVFALYYRHPIAVITWIAVAWMTSRLLSSRILQSAAVLIAVITTAQMMKTIITIIQPRTDAYVQEYRSSDIPPVLEYLSKRKGSEIVLAPINVSNLIPVLTQHYTLFTQYAHFEQVSDRELTERYLLFTSLFPLPTEQTVEGYPVVFGIAAGNLYGRTKMLCRLHLTTTNCEKSLEDFIPHQDLLSLLEQKSIDQIELLKKYAVTVIVTDRKLPMSVTRFCSSIQTIGVYDILECRFQPVTLRSGS